MGYDTRGRMVWPDSSIHALNPDYVSLYALPTFCLHDAKRIVAVVLRKMNGHVDAAWTPHAGTQRGNTSSLGRGLTYPTIQFPDTALSHTVDSISVAYKNRINPVERA